MSLFASQALNYGTRAAIPEATAAAGTAVGVEVLSSVALRAASYPLAVVAALPSQGSTAYVGSLEYTRSDGQRVRVDSYQGGGQTITKLTGLNANTHQGVQDSPTQTDTKTMQDVQAKNAPTASEPPARGSKWDPSWSKVAKWGVIAGGGAAAVGGGGALIGYGVSQAGKGAGNAVADAGKGAGQGFFDLFTGTFGGLGKGVGDATENALGGLGKGAKEAASNLSEAAVSAVPLILIGAAGLLIFKFAGRK